MNSSPAQLIKDHLFYEVWMLGSTRTKLMYGDFKDKKTCNALIESFCVHARNLNEFFLEKGQDDTLKASSFTTGEYVRPVNTEARKALFDMIHKQIAHLTKDRTTVPQDMINEEVREKIRVSVR